MAPAGRPPVPSPALTRSPTARAPYRIVRAPQDRKPVLLDLATAGRSTSQGRLQEYEYSTHRGPELARPELLDLELLATAAPAIADV